MRGFADDVRLGRVAAPRGLADHDQARRDPHLHPDVQVRRQVEAGRRAAQGEPGAQGVGALFLVRPGIAEVGEHAVIEVLGDGSAKLRNDLLTDPAMAVDHQHQVLGVEPAGQGDGVRGPAEERRDLAAFGGRSRGRRLDGPFRLPKRAAGDRGHAGHDRAPFRRLAVPRPWRKVDAMDLVERHRQGAAIKPDLDELSHVPAPRGLGADPVGLGGLRRPGHDHRVGGPQRLLDRVGEGTMGEQPIVHPNFEGGAFEGASEQTSAIGRGPGVGNEYLRAGHSEPRNRPQDHCSGNEITPAGRV